MSPHLNSSSSRFDTILGDDSIAISLMGRNRSLTLPNVIVMLRKCPNLVSVTLEILHDNTHGFIPALGNSTLIPALDLSTTIHPESLIGFYKLVNLTLQKTRAELSSFFDLLDTPSQQTLECYYSNVVQKFSSLISIERVCEMLTSLMLDPERFSREGFYCILRAANRLKISQISERLLES
ncbi:hypothetical protein BDN70DRAFT_935446 [Pholiota conissans]|uniref:Uncharacterized protein n=1 Tax=Pholiota conissans TaxID=109636 RepID=A0A9P5YV05_9AGAR|nr:hypothetical protein BDN70DRAFT_935446 [Pholiota conissans]